VFTYTRCLVKGNKNGRRGLEPNKDEPFVGVSLKMRWATGASWSLPPACIALPSHFSSRFRSTTANAPHKKRCELGVKAAERKIRVT
jgi:hypothetical protein